MPPHDFQESRRLGRHRPNDQAVIACSFLELAEVTGEERYRARAASWLAWRNGPGSGVRAA